MSAASNKTDIDQISPDFKSEHQPTPLPDNQTKHNATDTVSTTGDTISEADSVENVYALYEPDDTYGLDPVSGFDLIPLSKELAKAESYYSSYGMYRAFTRKRVEEKVSNLKNKFVKSISESTFSSHLGEEDEWIAKGSSMEGTLFPSLIEYEREQFMKIVLGENPTQHAKEMLVTFLDKANKTRYIVQAADIDIMIAPRRFHLHTEEAFLPTEHPTYYRLSVNIRDMDAWADCCESHSDKNMSCTVLSPSKTKDLFYSCLKMMSDSCMDDDTAMIVVPHGLAFQVTELRVSQNMIHAEMYDLAIAATCNFWPSVAKEWINRKRVWPSASEIKACTDGGVNMVIKSPTLDQDDLLWRVSFAKAETTICRLPLVYWYALRSWSLGKSFLQSFHYNSSPKLLTSYHVKTLFFYMLERLPKDYWMNEENMLKTLLALIDELITCLATQECTHYFLREINLLDSKSNPLPVDMFKTVARQLRTNRQTIVQDPMEYFFPGTRGTSIYDELDL